jgi:hypothetical protein
VNERRLRRPVGYLPCFIIVFAAMVVALRFFWPGVLMAFVLLGVTSPAVMLAVLVTVVIIGAAALQARFSRRPF